MRSFIQKSVRALMSLSLFSAPVLLPILAFSSPIDRDLRMAANEFRMEKSAYGLNLVGKVTCVPGNGKNGVTGTANCELQIEETKTGRTFTIENPEKVRNLLTQGENTFKVEGVRLGGKLSILSLTAMKDHREETDTSGT